MVESVNLNEDAYIKASFKNMPNLEKGESRIVKRGDCLWDIARSQLGKKSKRSEVSNYMLAIAKLNGLDTKQKMNNLKVNSTIYLPKNIAKVDKKSLPQNKVVKQQLPKTPAEKCFEDRMNVFFNDNTVKVKKALFLPDLYSELYHVSHKHVDKKGFVSPDKPIMSIKISKDTRKIESISFEDDRNLYDFGYDYDIGKDNVIRSSNLLNNELYGKITPEQRAKLEKEFFKHINKK